MPKFAFYKPADPAPQAVLGWYDTDKFKHVQLPPGEHLIEVTPEQWRARLDNPAGWLVKKGKVIPKEKKA